MISYGVFLVSFPWIFVWSTFLTGGEGDFGGIGVVALISKDNTSCELLVLTYSETYSSAVKFDICFSRRVKGYLEVDGPCDEVSDFIEGSDSNIGTSKSISFVWDVLVVVPIIIIIIIN